MTRTGRAAVLVKSHQMETWTVPVPDPDAFGVVIRVTLAGVCGSDVHIVNGHVGEMPFPIVLGHEGVGILEALGTSVKTDFAGVPVHEGDLVYWTPTGRCGRCYACTVLDQTPCENASYFEDASKPNWGAHADYVSLPAGHPFFRIPDGTPAEALAALGCALPTAVRGNDRMGAVRFGETVVVQGAGPVGLSSVLVARASGAREIIVIDQFPERLSMAARLGATTIVSLLDTTPEERAAAITELCGHNGPNVVMEAAGALPAFPEGLDILGNHGRYCVMGLWGAEGSIAVQPRIISNNNITVAGSAWSKPSHYYYAMHLVGQLAAELPLSDLISHRYSIEDISTALVTVEKGEAVKAVIDTSL